ncbi:hypothetical protein KIPB_013967, partial [Kipferlia bialata]|eukprot:g13967.t1
MSSPLNVSEMAREAETEYFTSTITPHNDDTNSPASFIQYPPKQVWDGVGDKYVLEDRSGMCIHEVLHLVTIQPGMALLLTAPPPPEGGQSYFSSTQRLLAIPNAYLVHVDASGSVEYECAASPPLRVSDAASMTPVCVSGQVVLAGGPTHTYPSLLVYSVDTDTWRQIPRVPSRTPGFFTTLAVCNLGDVAVIISQRSRAPRHNLCHKTVSDWEVWTFDPQTDTWAHLTQWNIHPRFVSNQ